MPTISMFFGILIMMRNEGCQRHHSPHIHVVYADYQAVYDFEGNALAGSLPIKQNKLVVAWIEIHKEELEANWRLATQGERVFDIEPLK